MGCPQSVGKIWSCNCCCLSLHQRRVTLNCVRCLTSPSLFEASAVGGPSLHRLHLQCSCSLCTCLWSLCWRRCLRCAQGHPTTVFCKISARRSKNCLEFSITRGRLTISRWPFQSCTIFRSLSEFNFSHSNPQVLVPCEKWFLQAGRYASIQSRNPISCRLFPEYRFLRQFCISCQDFEASTSWVAVKFRIPSINFVLSRIHHHISGQIVDPEIPPPDPVYGGQYILVFQLPFPTPASSFGK